MPAENLWRCSRCKEVYGESEAQFATVTAVHDPQLMMPTFEQLRSDQNLTVDWLCPHCKDAVVKFVNGEQLQDLQAVQSAVSCFQKRVVIIAKAMGRCPLCGGAYSAEYIDHGDYCPAYSEKAQSER